VEVLKKKLLTQKRIVRGLNAVLKEYTAS
jgi:hypothetical protein